MNIENRLEKVQTVSDMDTQINLAKKYYMRLKSEAKKKDTLAEKIEAQKKTKAAEKTLLALRRLVFDVEDCLAMGKPATSALK
jgi:phage protein D